MIFKQLVFTVSIVCSTLLIGQNDLVKGGAVFINGQLIGAENQKVVLVNQNFGGAEDPIAVANVKADGKFEIKTNIAVEDYYILMLENTQVLNLVIRPNDSLTINANANNLQNSSTISGSNDSRILNEFWTQYLRFKFVEDSVINIIRTDPSKKDEVAAFMNPIFQEFFAFRNLFINANQSSPGILSTLSAVNQQREWDTYKNIVAILNETFGGSPTVQNLYKAVVEQDANLKKQDFRQAELTGRFMPGSAAPEISLADPNGKIRNLSDLKGKVVLIDFWASWCGPCRKENPNVVKAYEKYKKDGFEVFSVSLDQSNAKDKWIQAIEVDKLTWKNHVSDLKGFSSVAAQAYGVNSIPFTILIDAKGNVISTNVRGPLLEQELKKIYGH